jgi:hypothetical protein
LFGQLQYSFSIDYNINPLNINGSTFKYNLWNGIQKLLEEKLYFISILLIIYSGIWPYIKLILVLVLSFTDVASDKYRIWLLNTISTLGKWSTLDVWVVLIIIVTININGKYNVMGIDVDILLEVIAMKGVYIYFIGIVLSQLLSQITIHYVKSSSSPLPNTLITNSNKNISNNNNNNDNNNDNNNNGNNDIFIEPNGTDDHYSMFRVIANNITRYYYYNYHHYSFSLFIIINYNYKVDVYQ